MKKTDTIQGNILFMLNVTNINSKIDDPISVILATLY